MHAHKTLHVVFQFEACGAAHCVIPFTSVGLLVNWPKRQLQPTFLMFVLLLSAFNCTFEGRVQTLMPPISIQIDPSLMPAHLREMGCCCRRQGCATDR